MSKIDQLKDKGIYFYFYFQDLYHLSVCIAEGLEELGVPIYSNRDYYKRIDGPADFLFKRSDSMPEDAAVCVVELTKIPEESSEMLEKLEKLRNARDVNLVCISHADSHMKIAVPNDIPLFITHENYFYQLPGNRIPWAFGISKQMLQKASESKTGDSRKKIILRNFRPSYNQTVRLAADLAFVNRLETHFAIDRKLDEDSGRFEASHFKKLNSYLGCLAYGGHFVEDLTINKYLSAHVKKQGRFLREPLIIRWDSWRFWEALICGCLTFHLDFDVYGFKLPVRPENWKHYIGLNFETPERDMEKLLDNFDKLPDIAKAGQEWALEHYSPVAAALRFIEKINLP